MVTTNITMTTSLRFEKLFAVVVLAAVVLTALFPGLSFAATEINVYGNSAPAYDQPGWLFNRDTNTDTPFTFTSDEASLGLGSLYVLPIGANASDKFIGELFVRETLSDVESISYDYRLGDTVPANQVNQFYANVYVNFTDNGDYGHCVYNVVPTNGTAGWHTMTFDPEATYDVRTRGSAPATCPARPADLPDTAHLRMFALNLGDTSVNDQGVDGYFDKVVVTTVDDVLTYDLEIYPRSATITNPTAGEEVSGVVNFTATLTDLAGDDSVQWAVRAGTCAANTGTIYGNVDGYTTPFTWNGNAFSAIIDMSDDTPGEYCFVFNPSESAGDTPIRLTSEFTLEAPEEPQPITKDQCKQGGFADFGFKNQGQCIRFVETGKDSR